MRAGYQRLTNGERFIVGAPMGPLTDRPVGRLVPALEDGYRRVTPAGVRTPG
jgi:hypothetical protein